MKYYTDLLLYESGILNLKIKYLNIRRLKHKYSIVLILQEPTYNDECS